MQFDNEPILDYFYKITELPFSNDLLQIIMDYLFPRVVKKFHKKDIISYLRFGPRLMANKLAYEIRAYNKGETHIFSTFAINDFDFDRFSHIQGLILREIDWNKIFFSHASARYIRYAFSHVTNRTYIVQGYDNYDIEIKPFKTISNWHISVGNADNKPHMKSTIIKCCETIQNWGEDWDRLPKLEHEIRKRSCSRSRKGSCKSPRRCSCKSSRKGTYKGSRKGTKCRISPCRKRS
jgi:hypothetical protein